MALREGEMIYGVQSALAPPNGRSHPGIEQLR